MLSELSIRNFAIIESLDIEFERGLTVLTGETGAGKSIIIDAVQLLAGGRGSQQFIRHGAERAEIEGLFYVDVTNEALLAELAANDISVGEDRMLIIRRTLSRKGKTTCRVNGKLTTIAAVRTIASHLVDIHGQHENQELMNDKHHIHLLDHFAPPTFEEAHRHYTELYEEYVELRKKLRQTVEDEQTIAQHIDLYTFQLNEIDEANLVVGEDEALEKEQQKLQHFHRLFERLTTAYESLNGESKGLDYIGSAMSDLEDAATIDDDMKPISETVSASFYSLQDVIHSLSSTIDDMAFDPMRVEEVESRLALLATLKRKYGQTVEAILTYREEIEEKLDRLLHRDEQLAEEQERLAQVEADLAIEANELSLIRQETAKRLEKAVMEQLEQLYMEKATFRVSIETKEPLAFDANGSDDVQFLISTNVGEPLKPLTQIASGGEISRMMLALKTIFSKTQGVTSLIFDEVDTGVSGRVAQAIADKIATIAVHSQVLCISHLPQVAAMADYHYFISKRVEEDRTVTRVRAIEHASRVEELSRMLSGAEITPLSLRAAEELLELAKERKQTFAEEAEQSN